MKRAFILLILIICGHSIYCQTFYIKGKIVDDKLSDLLAVNVKNLTSNKYVRTDENGLFGIQAKLGDTIEFSFVGLTTDRVTIADTANIKLIMMDKSVNCLGAEWSKREYKKADKRIQKRLEILYRQADKKRIWQDLR